MNEVVVLSVSEAIYMDLWRTYGVKAVILIELFRIIIAIIAMYLFYKSIVRISKGSVWHKK